MISCLDDQQLSSMQSTSELGDSRKELRQVECCVHGRPCAIASKLSRERQQKAYRDSSSGWHSLFGKPEPRVRDDISCKLHRKVEREALDVPIRTWNLRAPHLSTSSLSSEPITHVSEIEDMGLLRIASKERHTGPSVDRSSIDQVKKRITSKERYDQYEMMRPTTLAPPPMSKEQVLWTARKHCSAEMPPSVEAYIGVMTAKQAEGYVVKPTSFKLYHLMPKIESLNNVLPSLDLYIIYRSGSGHAYHYPIRQRKQHVDYSKTRSRLTVVNNLQVEYGDPTAPWFFTLDALVSYYNIYVHLYEVNGECVADIFPVNGMQHSSKLHQHASSVSH